LPGAAHREYEYGGSGDTLTAMGPRPLPSPALPFALPDCIIDDVRAVGVMLLIEAHTTLPRQRCPACDAPTARIHSRYLRLVRDLPVADRSLRLLLRVRALSSRRQAKRRRYLAPRPPRGSHRAATAGERGHLTSVTQVFYNTCVTI